MTETTTLSFYERLKQRSVFRVGTMYLAVSWLLLQIGDITFDTMGLPQSFEKTLLILLIVGLPIALVLAWIYDITPGGIVRSELEEAVDSSGETTKFQMGRKLDFAIIGVLILALVMALWNIESVQNTSDEVAGGAMNVYVVRAHSIGGDQDTKHVASLFSDALVAKFSEIKFCPQSICANAKIIPLQSKADFQALLSTQVNGFVLEVGVEKADGVFVFRPRAIDTRTRELLWTPVQPYLVTDPASSSELEYLGQRIARVTGLHIKEKVFTQHPDIFAASIGVPEFEAEALDHMMIAGFQFARINMGETGSWIVAEQHLKQVLKTHPDNYRALALRANVNAQRHFFGAPLFETLPIVEESLRRAGEVRKDSGHSGTIQMQLRMQLNYRAAESSIDDCIDQHATRLNWCWYFRANIAIREGRKGDALKALQVANSIATTNGLMINAATNAWDTYLLGQYHESVSRGKRALQYYASPEWRVRTLLVLAWAYRGLGDSLNAEAVLRRAALINPLNQPESRALVYASLHRNQEALDILMQGDVSSMSPFYLALTYMELGEFEQSYEVLLRAVEQNSFGVIDSIRWGAFWDPLRCHPGYEQRFSAAIAKVEKIEQHTLGYEQPEYRNCNGVAE